MNNSIIIDELSRLAHTEPEVYAVLKMLSSKYGSDIYWLLHNHLEEAMFEIIKVQTEIKKELKNIIEKDLMNTIQPMTFKIPDELVIKMMKNLNKEI